MPRDEGCGPRIDLSKVITPGPVRVLREVILDWVDGEFKEDSRYLFRRLMEHDQGWDWAYAVAKDEIKMIRAVAYRCRRMGLEDWRGVLSLANRCARTLSQMNNWYGEEKRQAEASRRGFSYGQDKEDGHLRF